MTSVNLPGHLYAVYSQVEVGGKECTVGMSFPGSSVRGGA